MFVHDHKSHVEAAVFSCRKILSGKAEIGQEMVIEPMPHLKEGDQPAPVKGEFGRQAALSEKGVVKPKRKMMYSGSQVPIHLAAGQL